MLFIFISCDALLNANRKAFDSNADSLKVHNLYFVAHACICILFLPEQWKCHTKFNLTVLFHFLICTYSTNTLYLQLVVEEGHRKERSVGCPVFPRPLCHWHHGERLANTRKWHEGKRMCLGLLVVRVLTSQAWALGSWAQGLHLDTLLPKKQNAKEIVGTKNNCRHVQLGQPATFEEPGANVGCQEQKQGTEHAPWTQHHLLGGQTRKPPLQLNRWTSPDPHPMQGTSFPTYGSKEAMELIACSCSSLL